MLKIKLLLFISLFSITLFGQENLNKYKYILVPNQFEFQKNAGDYDLNRLTKFLFKKYGFNALLSDETYPEDLAINRCLGLTAQLRKQSSLFKSKIKVELVNCYNEVVFTSIEASSKEKDYKKAYHEATRKSFQSFNGLNYNYQPNEVKNQVVQEQVTVEKVEEKPKEIEDVVVKNDKIDKKNNHLKVTEINDETFIDEALESILLYAQPIENGFQLIDKTPKKVYVIKETSMKDVFIVKDKNGILYKQNNEWVLELYHDNQLVKIKMNIKF